jgi:outer membrane protein assembly factor BamB
VARHPTTICCSAVALIALCAGLRAQPAAPPQSLFPARALWTLALNNALTVPPAYDGARGFFSIESGRIAAYELAAGRQLWIGAAQPLSRPAAGENLLFLREPDVIRALRQENGSVAWQRPFADTLSTALVYDNGWLIAATDAGSIVAFRAADGERIWSRDIGAAAHAVPSLAADRVYVPAASGRIIALHAGTGDLLWERRLGGLPNEMLALDERLYVGSADNFLYCVKAANGEVLWRVRTGADVLGAPVADDERVYFVSLDNVLRGIDRGSGSQRWKRGLAVRPFTGPLLVSDALIVTGLAPPSRGYRIGDGAPAGELPATGEMAAPPYAVPGLALPVVVLVTRDIAKGAIVTAVGRSIEPAVAPIAPLPNPVQVTP